MRYLKKIRSKDEEFSKKTRERKINVGMRVNNRNDWNIYLCSASYRKIVKLLQSSQIIKRSLPVFLEIKGCHSKAFFTVLFFDIKILTKY